MSFFSRFGQRWANLGTSIFPTNDQSNAGLAFLGDAAPPLELHNAIFQQLDDKDNFIFTQLNNLATGTGIAPFTENGGSLQFTQMVATVGKRLLFASTTPGTTSFTVPAGVTSLYGICIAGGGGGSNCIANSASQAGNSISGGSGGAGGMACRFFGVYGGQVVPIVIGPGGPAQMMGGSSSVANLFSATGGQGSSFGSANTSPRGMGGTATGGDWNFPGNPGMDGQAGTLYHIGTNGGAGPFGGAGAGAERGGLPGTGPGSGGGGAYDSQNTATNYAGGNGANGAVYLFG